MKNKRLTTILLCTALIVITGLFGLTGCGKEAAPEDNGNGGEPLAEQTYRITMFFANEDYVESGDESMEKYKVFEKEITSEPGKVYQDALEELKVPPEEGYSTVVGTQISFNEVYLDGDTVKVDLSSSSLSGGSTDEAFLIGQIVNTLINSFNEVKQVQFLVDGEVAESLMGHVDAQNPFTKDVFD